MNELSPAYAAVVARALSEDAAGRRSIMDGLGRTMRLLPGVEAWENLFGTSGDEEDTHGVIMEGGVAQRRPEPKHLLPPAVRRQMAAISSMLSEAGAACNDMASSAADRYEGATRYLRDLRRQRMFSVVGNMPSDI